ncbi:MAG: serine--tRNA ligase, partial [Candidatus Thiodiazotropha sp. (ex Notomyrtea botanica)]|nr:serine--tRNA ligase [Candidatus Thiodiazotropha sp. (ex Notomyrtea botanica)]
MLDPRLLRNNLQETATQLARRGYQLDTQRISELEERRKQLQVDSQELQNERNSRSKSIGKAKAAGEDIQPLLAQVAELGENLKSLQEALNKVQDEIAE